MTYKIPNKKLKEKPNLPNSKKKYTIVFDAGKPYSVSVENESQLKDELNKFYQEHKEEDDYFDAKIYNQKGEDISESQFVDEIMGEILE